MKKLDANFPSLLIGSLAQVESGPTLEAIKSLADLIRLVKESTDEAVNYNSFDEVTQAAQPTPEDGRFYIWKDSDATTGQPTHYIVAEMGGIVVTFASEETVP